MEDIATLKGISNFANSSDMTNLLDPINYHFILFSTLYQSGTNYFQTYKPALPNEIQQSSFWNEKLVDIDNDAYSIAKSKTEKILEGKLNLNLDDPRGKYFKLVIEVHLANLLYATQTGSSFLTVHGSLEEHLPILEKHMEKELWLSLKNLSALIKPEQISTVTPKFTILKDDIKRFEDISYTRLYKNYQDSIGLLEYGQIDKIKKEISTNSLKLFNKYGNYISLNETAFNLIKFSKKIIDSFAYIAPPFVGDFIISSAEKMMENKKTIQFYNIKELNYENLLVSRIEEKMKKILDAKKDS